MAIQEFDELIKSEKPLTWLFYGDSITHGSFHTFGHRDYVELFEERIRSELDRRLDVFINTAISGNTTKELVETFEWRVKRFSPDIAFLMIGMNDCSEDSDVTLETYRNNLEQLVSMFQEMNTRLILQTTCPILPGTADDREPHFSDYMDAIRNIAKSKSIPLIDHTKYWRQNIEQHNFWMSDSFHPNQYGHQAFAALLFHELGLYDSNSISCRLFKP